MTQKTFWPKWLSTQEVILFLLLLLSYTYVFPRWADPNQNSRLDMVVAVVDDGTFQIDKYVHNTVDYAKVGDHYYSDKAPGAAFLGIPVYAGLRLFLDLPVMDNLMNRLTSNEAFKSTLRTEGSGILEEKVRFAIAQIAIALVVAAVPSALLGVLMFRWLAYLTPLGWPRWVVVLSYGLLTPAFAYAGAFYGHQLSAALLFGAFYLAFAGLQVKRSTFNVQRLLAIGLLLGYSVVTEYPTMLMVGILYLYTCYVVLKVSVPTITLSSVYRLPSTVYRQIAWVTIPAVLVAAAWMAYNTTVFGGPLELGYSHSELWTEQHHTGFMSLNLPQAAAIWGITFGLFRGLFVLSPWLLLALPGFWLWYRSGRYRAEWLVALASVVVIFLFNSSSVMWWGGFAIGPRYLLPALPFMALPLVFVLDHRIFSGSSVVRLLFMVLLGWSFVATWGLTLAEQAFPSDTIYNPLLNYALPNWLAGNIARNLGTILGLRGGWSLLPLLLALGLIGLGGWLLNRRSGPPAALKLQHSTASARR